MKKTTGFYLACIAMGFGLHAVAQTPVQLVVVANDA